MLANILAGPLMSLSEHLSSLTKPGGHVVLSGILRDQADDVSRTYQQWFRMAPATIDGDWVRLTGDKTT